MKFRHKRRLCKTIDLFVMNYNIAIDETTKKNVDRGLHNYLGHALKYTENKGFLIPRFKKYYEKRKGNNHTT